MNCPHCQSPATGLILETRKHEDDVYRRRACANCGKSVITREHAEAALKMPYRVREDKKQSTSAVMDGMKSINRDAFKAWR